MIRYRFGTFEFASENAELWRDGMPVRLQLQPAQVLSVLLEHAGQIVTRDTLQQRVWADGTQVDFERGLNYCIAQVRSALGDSADSPRFVRTIPKKGYQFIAPIELVTASVPSTGRRMTRRAWVAVGAASVGIGGLGFWLSRGFGARQPIVAVCLFDNETGESEFDRIASGFSDALTAELASSGAGRVRVIGNADILRKPRPQRNPSQIHLTLGADYVIIGQVQKDTDNVRVLAHLLRMPSQTHVKVERLEAPRLENPLAAETEFARRTAARFLKALDGSSPAVAGH